AQFADVTVSPNPFHNQLRIANGSLEGEYILLNAQGVKVASGALKASETIVNTSKLSTGIYLLQLNAAGGATKTYRVVK
ncbi:MAG: T9SS type A sorting domain-containing protein, partial [Bacteroides sp.]